MKHDAFHHLSKFPNFAWSCSSRQSTTMSAKDRKRDLNITRALQNERGRGSPRVSLSGLHSDTFSPCCQVLSQLLSPSLSCLSFSLSFLFLLSSFFLPSRRAAAATDSNNKKRNKCRMQRTQQLRMPEQSNQPWALAAEEKFRYCSNHDLQNHL